MKERTLRVLLRWAEEGVEVLAVLNILSTVHRRQGKTDPQGARSISIPCPSSSCASSSWAAPETCASCAAPTAASPLVALLWTCQLYALLLAASALGYALARDTPSDEVPTRHAILFLRGAAQCVFTASQFAVTLEFFKRSLHSRGAATGAARPAAPVSRGLPRGRFIA